MSLNLKFALCFILLVIVLFCMFHSLCLVPWQLIHVFQIRVKTLDSANRLEIHWNTSVNAVVDLLDSIVKVCHMLYYWCLFQCLYIAVVLCLCVLHPLRLPLGQKKRLLACPQLTDRVLSPDWKKVLKSKKFLKSFPDRPTEISPDRRCFLKTFPDRPTDRDFVWKTRRKKRRKKPDRSTLPENVVEDKQTILFFCLSCHSIEKKILLAFKCI